MPTFLPPGISPLYRENANLFRRRILPGMWMKLGASSPLGPSAQPGGPMMFDGDSLTYGVGAVPGTSDYPTQLVALLGSDYTLAINDGVAGETISQINSGAASHIDTLYDATKPQCWSVIWGGTNDLITGTSGNTVWTGTTGLRDYIRDRIAVGFKVICLTCLPRAEFAANSAEETERQNLNTLIRNNVAAEGFWLADVAADGRIGDLGDEQSSYYDTDHIHMTASGYAVVAEIVAGVIRESFRV